MKYQPKDRVTVTYRDAIGNPLYLISMVMHEEKVGGADGYRVNLGAISIAFPEDELKPVNEETKT